MDTPEIDAPTRRRGIGQRLFFSLVRIGCGVPIVSLLAVGLLFAAFSVTWKGRCIGLSVLLVGGALYLVVGSWNRPWFKARWARVLLLLLVPGVLLASGPLVLTPDGGAENTRVRNAYLGGMNRFHRFAPLNVIPEVDQVSVGLTLLPFGDPYVNSAKGRRMRRLVLPTYKQMEYDPEFRNLGSAMGPACRDLLHLDFRDGHYYVFLPDADPGQRLPCLVFLHGMGGNIKPYFWMLSRLSERRKCIIIAPTFGMGFWEKEGSAQFVVNVTREAIATLPTDANRVFLMGYSQGAVGVTRAAVLTPGLYRGLVYVSPITEDDLFGTPEFASQKNDLRLLFLHGRDDLRIPCNFVEGTARILRQTGYDVRIQVYEDEDHYAILSQQDAVLDQLARFISEDDPEERTTTSRSAATRPTSATSSSTTSRSGWRRPVWK